MSLYVRNFSKYQHYKDRRPPWVKLHRTFLDDPHMMELSAGTRFIALGFVLLASESPESGTSRRVVGSEKELCRRLGVKPSELRAATKALLDCGFCASSPLAGRKRNARLYQEQEEEKEKDITANRSELRVPIDDEKRHELRRIVALCRDVNGGSMSVLEAEAGGLPLASLAKVRESLQLRGTVGVGYAVNALRSERGERDGVQRLPG